MHEKPANPYRPPESDVLPDPDATLNGRRIRLVPLWIMILSWILLFAAVLSIALLVYLLLSGDLQRLSVINLLDDGGKSLREMLLFFFVPPLLGVGARGLLFGTWWGAKAALVAGYVALFLALWPLLASPSRQGLFTSYELPLLLFYLFTLHRIHARWSLDR